MYSEKRINRTEGSSSGSGIHLEVGAMRGGNKDNKEASEVGEKGTMPRPWGIFIPRDDEHSAAC